jgi:hypothetical protein
MTLPHFTALASFLATATFLAATATTAQTDPTTQPDLLDKDFAPNRYLPLIQSDDGQFVKLRNYRNCVSAARAAAERVEATHDVSTVCSKELDALQSHFTAEQKAIADAVTRENRLRREASEDALSKAKQNDLASGKTERDFPRGHAREISQVAELSLCQSEATRSGSFTVSDCPERIGLDDSDLAAIRAYQSKVVEEFVNDPSSSP